MILSQVMKTTWVIENFVKEPSYKKLTDAAKELGYSVIELNSDFSKDILRKKLVESKVIVNVSGGQYGETCVVANGSIKMCKLISETLNSVGIHPLLLPSFEKYKCTAYYSHFGPYLFNDKYCLMTLKELVRQKYDVWGHYGKECLIFIRPDSGEKLFQAGLLDIIDLAQFHESNKDCEHELVSTPKTI